MSTVALAVFGLVSLLTVVSLLPPLAARLHLPHSVLLALVGSGLGVISLLNPGNLGDHAPGMGGDLLSALQSFEISPEAFIVIFLPALLFETALAIDVRRLLDDLAPVLTLAVIAVIICTLVVGVVLAQISGFGLVVCLLLGAIVATTDPAAVVSVFREVGAPKRLTTLVEGESLLNDAAAIALFVLLLDVLMGQGDSGGAQVLTRFLVSFLGGGLFGFALAWATTRLFPLLKGWPRAEITLTISLAYLSFFIGEHYLHVSGVVACVVAGLVIGSTAKTRLSPETSEQLEGAWGQLGFWANSLIFLIAAMFVPRIMQDMTWGEGGFILVLYVATLAARAATVFGLLPILTTLGVTQRIGGGFKAVILWGGLRGAVSLALGLTVAENAALPDDIRHFIATTVTGYVLMTLFLNGISLRPLMRLLKLNRLSSVALGVRDRAVIMTLSEVRDGLAAIGSEGRIDREVGETVLREFDARLAAERAHRTETRALKPEQLLKVGLTVLTAHETERCFTLLKANVIDRSMAEQLLAQAQRLRETVRALGHLGFEAAWQKNLGYSLRFRISLMLHNRLGLEQPLADALANRFELLMNQRMVLAETVPFCRAKLASLLGEEGTEALIALTAKRAAGVNAALNALKLQYPAYADALQRQYLGKLARDMEHEGYRTLYNQAVISGEVWQSLTGDAERRWRESGSGGDQDVSLDRRPKLDTELSAQQLIAKVPIFRDLNHDAQQRIARLLRPEMTLPDQAILKKGDKGDSMYFIASGAVRVAVGNDGIELGSGNFFGELALLTGQPRSADVISLGFCRLLQLSARDFRRLLEGDPALKDRIETVAKERLGQK